MRTRRPVWLARLSRGSGWRLSGGPQTLRAARTRVLRRSWVARALTGSRSRDPPGGLGQKIAPGHSAYFPRFPDFGAR